MASPKLAPPRPTVIGFAYGTFDLLHDGHIYFLRRARRRCDQLIVALQSDRFAGEIKGPGRPVDNEAVRSHNVIATGLVSLVVAVDDYNQLREAMRYYDADVLFVGADQRAVKVMAPPDGVVLIPLLPGHSTSRAIRERLQ